MVLMAPKVGRVTAQIVQKNLHHAGDGRPKIGLFGVIVNGFDRPGICEGQRNLNLANARREPFLRRGPCRVEPVQ